MLVTNAPSTPNTAASRPSNQNSGSSQFAYAASHQEPRRVLQ
jgi:hypothetical protein